jgi:hypothetical protein
VVIEGLSFDSRQTEPTLNHQYGQVKYPHATTFQPLIDIEKDMVITYGTRKTPLL